MTTVTRAQLGLPASPASRRDLGYVEGATIHHTTGATLAGQSAQNAPDAFAWVRNIWSFHTAEPLPAHYGLPATDPWEDARGWDDVGYHQLVHIPLQLVFDGRPLDRVGAHARGPANTDRIGVAVLGGGVLLDAADERWLAGVLDGIRRKIGAPAAGWVVDGHRDHGQTTCPGPLYASLPRLQTPGVATPPRPSEPSGATDMERTAALLDVLATEQTATRRLALASATLAVARARADLGHDPSSVDDARWAARFAAGKALPADALAALRDK